MLDNQLIENESEFNASSLICSGLIFGKMVYVFGN